MPDENKVFMVNVNINFQMVVVATSKEEAENRAESNYIEDIEGGGHTVEAFDAYPVTTVSPSFQKCLPWGPCDQDPRRDWTVKQWLEAAKKEAAHGDV